MTDLYAALGVQRDADRATIRRAYREKARRAHPDGGGTSQDFTLLKTAYDTLIDPARRRRYDETGEVGKAPIDNQRKSLLEMLAAGLDLAMFRLDKRGQQPKHADMVRLTCEALRERRQEWINLRRKFEKTAESSRELLGRFSADSDDNLMEIVIARRVAVCQTEIEALNARIKVVDEALDVLNRMTFQADQQPQLLPDPQWIAMVELVRRHG